MNLRLCIEINFSFLIPFSIYHTFSAFQINIVNIQIYKFSDTNSGRVQQINHC